jgi:hypothetical protein
MVWSRDTSLPDPTWCGAGTSVPADSDPVPSRDRRLRGDKKRERYARSLSPISRPRAAWATEPASAWLPAVCSAKASRLWASGEPVARPTPTRATLTASLRSPRSMCTVMAFRTAPTICSATSVSLARHARAPLVTTAPKVQHPGGTIPDDHAADRNLRLTPEADQGSALADDYTKDGLSQQRRRNRVPQLVQQHGDHERRSQRRRSDEPREAGAFDTCPGSQREPGGRDSGGQAQPGSLAAAAGCAAGAFRDVLPARLAARAAGVVVGRAIRHAGASITGGTVVPTGGSLAAENFGQHPPVHISQLEAEQFGHGRRQIDRLHRIERHACLDAPP